jgi:hypothetical protein
MAELPFHGSSKKAKSVTHVSGTKCYLCLRPHRPCVLAHRNAPLPRSVQRRLQGFETRSLRHYEEAEIDVLRGRVLVDLYSVLRQGASRPRRGNGARLPDPSTRDDGAGSRLAHSFPLTASPEGGTVPSDALLLTGPES